MAYVIGVLLAIGDVAARLIITVLTLEQFPIEHAQEMFERLAVLVQFAYPRELPPELSVAWWPLRPHATYPLQAHYRALPRKAATSVRRAWIDASTISWNWRISTTRPSSTLASSLSVAVERSVCVMARSNVARRLSR
jgi:hypothetical protein